MKVSVADFEIHLMPFIKRMADSMPTSLHKWLGGAVMAMNARKIEEFARSRADADGMLDLDGVRKLVDAGFQCSGGDVTVPFGSDTLEAFGVKTVNIRITKSDADEFFAGFSE